MAATPERTITDDGSIPLTTRAVEITVWSEGWWSINDEICDSFGSANESARAGLDALLNDMLHTYDRHVKERALERVVELEAELADLKEKTDGLL